MNRFVNGVAKTLKTSYKIAAGIVRFAICLPLIIIGGYGIGKEIDRQMHKKKVDIAQARSVTTEEIKQDFIARGTDDAIKDAQLRQLHQMVDPKNDSTYYAFMTQFDTLKLNTIAEKAFAVDLIVDAQIRPASDDVLYGEKHWATDLETIEKGRGDDKNVALFKYDILGRMGVPENRRMISVFNTAKTAKTQYEVMVNVSDSSTEEKFVLLPRNNVGDTAQLDESKYTYHIAINRDSIRYITPPYIAPKK